MSWFSLGASHILNIKLFIRDFCKIGRISRLSGDRELMFAYRAVRVGTYADVPTSKLLKPGEASKARNVRELAAKLLS